MAAFAALTRRFVLAAGLIGLALASAQAQVQVPAPAKPEMRESCPGMIASDRPRTIPAAFDLAALAGDRVRITYSGHSTFLLESPKLVRVATDYNDYIRTPVLPDIVTMNHAHPNHYTDLPDPDIKFVLRGWRDDGKPAGHDVSFGDVRVRSVSTNIRNWNGGTEFNGNSIFVFEMGNLCIAHLGHLHYTLTQQQLDEMGRIDVLLVPVDGAFTMDMDGMVEVVRSIRAPLMVPMHFFNTSALHRFLDRVSRHYDIDYAEVPSFVVSKETLPAKPKFLVLPGH